MGALDGIQVVEVGLLVQGPQAAATLGAWGADVVKVELPGFGDQSRWLPMTPEDPRSAYFIACNRGKRSITLDLRRRPGRDAFLRLIEQADVVITNFTPGTMEGWGLGYEDVSARNPGIVYASGSTFGPVGLDSARAGADLSGQAAGGLISTTGCDGGDPTPIGATIADHIASQNVVAGVLAALLSRAGSGRGQRVDTSLIGGQIWAQASEYTAYLLTGRVSGRANRSHPLVPGLYGILRTADGWLAVVGLVGQAKTKFFELVGRPELSERFPGPYFWPTDRAELFPILDEALSTRTTVEWCEAFSAAGLRHAPVRNHAEVVADPGVWDNGYFTKVPAANASSGSNQSSEEAVVAPPVRFSETPASPAGAVPELGQHTEEVLLELGYSWEQIGELRAAGGI